MLGRFRQQISGHFFRGGHCKASREIDCEFCPEKEGDVYVVAEDIAVGEHEDDGFRSLECGGD